MKLRNIQNGAVVKVVSEDQVRKVVQVEFEADGKTKDFSMSTIKRWWREIKDDTVEEPVAEETVNEENEETPDNQVTEETAQEEKKVTKKAKTPKPKKESKKSEAPKFDSEALRNHIEKTVSKWKDTTIVVRKKKDGNSMNKLVFKAGSHMFGTMTFSRTNVTINVKAGISTLKPTKTVNSFFDCKYIYTEDTDKVRDTIISLLTSAYESQVVKNNEVKTKSKKEEK